MPRPALPKLPLAGVVNAAGSNHWVTVCGNEIAPLTSGRSVVRVGVAAGIGSADHRGEPVAADVMLSSVLICQPESNCPLPSGSSYSA